MIRVVLDTNIVVSALLRSGSLPEAALRPGLNRVVQLCVSGAVLAEYEEVLGRVKLGIPKQKVAVALRQIREVSLLVSPSADVTACSDPDDNIFLECAQAGAADYLVTGNTAHFPDVWDRTRIVTARQFLETAIDLQFEE